MKIKKIVALTLVFLFATFVFTYPAIFHIRDRIIGDGNDSSLLIGWQYIAKTQTEKGVWPFSWTNYWRYPSGFDFSMGYDSVIFIGIGLFLYVFSQNPILVYNTSILIILFFNILLSYFYFRKIAKTELIGLVGSIIYGFSFYVLARLGGHMNLLLVGVFPFFLYSLILVRESAGTSKSFTMLALSIVLTMLASLQYFTLLICALILIVPVFALIYPELTENYLKVLRKKPVKFAAACFSTILVFIIFFKNHLYAFWSGNLITTDNFYMTYLSPKIFNFYVLNTYMKLLISKFGLPTTDYLAIEGSVFIGFVELLLFAGFFWSNQSKKIKQFIFVSALIIFIITLGCSSPFLPFCFLYNTFPFRAISEASRFYSVLYLIITTGVVMFLNSLYNSSKWIVIIIALFIILERIPSGFYLSPIIAKDTPFISAVRSQDSDAVLDLPIVDQFSDSVQKTKYDLYSIFYGKPIVGGSIHWLSNSPESISYLKYLVNFTCGTTEAIDKEKLENQILPQLKKYNIRTLVFHKKPESFAEGPSFCDLAMENINSFFYGLDVHYKIIYEDAKEVVIELE